MLERQLELTAFLIFSIIPVLLSIIPVEYSDITGLITIFPVNKTIFLEHFCILPD